MPAMSALRRRQSSHAVTMGTGGGSGCGPRRGGGPQRGGGPRHGRGREGWRSHRLRERWAVVEAEGGGGVDVLGADDVAALEVGDCSGDAEDARVAAGAERVAVVELAEQAQGARGDLPQLADLAGGELGVAGFRLSLDPAGLTLADGH